jgi:hypothetical protein
MAVSIPAATVLEIDARKIFFTILLMKVENNGEC